MTLAKLVLYWSHIVQIQNKTQEDIWIVVLSWVRMTWGNSCDVAWPWPRPHIPPLVRPHSLLSLADQSHTRVLIGHKRLQCQGRVRPQATHTATLRRITRAWDSEWGDAFLDSVVPCKYFRERGIFYLKLKMIVITVVLRSGWWFLGQVWVTAVEVTRVSPAAQEWGGQSLVSQANVTFQFITSVKDGCNVLCIKSRCFLNFRDLRQIEMISFPMSIVFWPIL